MIDENALWLAACLASESARPDRLLDDPYASHLAGTRGAQVFAERATSGRALDAALAVAIVDELTRHVVLDQQVHTVLELGAGLDTRPFRLHLPRDLRWIELDAEPLLLYKGFRLAHVTPTCRVEHVAVDLADVAQCDMALRRLSRSVARGLLITESARQRFDIEALLEFGANLSSGIKWWILGVSSDKQAVLEDLVATLGCSGWQIAECHTFEDEVRRVAPARIDLASLSPSNPDSGAVWLLRRVIGATGVALPRSAEGVTFSCVA